MSRLTVALREWHRRTTSWRARSRVRRRARRLSDGGHWLPAPISPSFGFAINGLDEAMAEACNRLGLTLVDQPKHGYLDRSRSATVSAADGALCWLKVNGITAGSAAQWLRTGEETADQIQGVPRPTIIKIADWNADDVQWRALLMSLAPCCTAASTPNDCPESKSISDAWIGDLKASFHEIGRLPSPRRRFEPKFMSHLLVDRFNLNAPIRVEEWRTAHGDMHWGNLTVPKLMLLDWELWGAAPPGYDAARLIAFSCARPELVERLRAVFTEELDTPSGRVTQLLACAELLATIESGHLSPRLYQPVESLARQVLRTV